jgi:hypothetical protein
MNNTFIKGLADYILLNAYSVRSAGLYDGKSGISLCLFETAYYLNEDDLAEKAFDLLQESIVIADNSYDLGFENGLTGIGFIILYLIENKFIDADFHELFERQFSRIQEGMKEKSDASSFFDIRALLFWDKYSRNQKSVEYREMIDKRFRDEEIALMKLLQAFDNIRNVVDRSRIIQSFITYVKICWLCKRQASTDLVLQYFRLYRKNRITYNFTTCFILDSAIKPYDADWSITVSRMRELYVATTSYSSFLYQRIETLVGFYSDYAKNLEFISRLEKEIINDVEPDYEKRIIQRIPIGRLIAGYGFGIARLLLYCAYKKLFLDNQDCSRFNVLF